MGENEYDIFSRLDREIGHDLATWRHDILARFEACCRAAFEIEEAKTNEPLNLTDPTVYQAIKSHVIDFLITDWIDHEASPRPGDLISATGKSYWYTQDGNDGVLTALRLPAGHKVQGTLTHWDILPYIDEEGLEADAHKHPELIYKFFRPFGVHFILDNPTLTNEAGTLLPIHPERVYLPIHYEQSELRVYGSPQ